MKKILILGAGNAQYDAIKYCKEKGYEVHGLSYTNTDKSIPLCDYFEQINIVDVESVKEYAKKIDADLIYSVGSDIAMPTATKVSEELNKPRFIKYETALICNTKSILRSTLGNDFNGNIKFKIVNNKEDLKDIDFFPVVMKPVDSQGQRGIFECNNLEELIENFDNSMSYSRKKELIVEEFISGEEISVNAYLVNGELKYSLISDRVSFTEFPGGIIKEHIVPSKFNSISDKILDLCTRTLSALEINNGPAYFQIMVSNDLVPYIIEVTPRLDGCHMWNLIKNYEDIDLLDITFKHLLGEDLDFTFNKNSEKMGLYFMCKETDRVFNLDEFTPPTEYKYLRWYYQNGDVVRKLNGYMEKCGYYIK